MDDILHTLYHGGLFPAESILSRNPEYRPANRKMAEENRYFESKQCAEDRERFEALENLRNHCACMQEEAAFCDGFKLCAALLLAAHTGFGTVENG